MYDSRTIHAHEIFDEIAQVARDEVFQTFIKRTIQIANASVEGEPIIHYATDSEATQAYREPAQEIT